MHFSIVNNGILPTISTTVFFELHEGVGTSVLDILAVWTRVFVTVCVRSVSFCSMSCVSVTRDSKLTMLLRESLGNMNCRTTMIAHISASPRDFSETLFTIQIASRVLRMKKKKAKVAVVSLAQTSPRFGKNSPRSLFASST